MLASTSFASNLRLRTEILDAMSRHPIADRAYTAIARAADAQGISVSQYVREAALIRAVLDELDSAEEALHTGHDLLAIAREVRRLA